MKNKIKSIITIAVIVILLIIIGVYIFYFYETDKTPIDLDNFRDMANNASCADVTNKLFVIDNQMVFWVVEGNCPDASYSYTLFGSTPDKILCKKFDSITGPQEQCFDNDFQDLFLTIIDNIGVNDLGLGAYHTVTEINF